MSVFTRIGEELSSLNKGYKVLKHNPAQEAEAERLLKAVATNAPGSQDALVAVSRNFLFGLRGADGKVSMGALTDFERAYSKAILKEVGEGPQGVQAIERFRDAVSEAATTPAKPAAAKPAEAARAPAAAPQSQGRGVGFAEPPAAARPSIEILEPDSQGVMRPVGSVPSGQGRPLPSRGSTESATGSSGTRPASAAQPDPAPQPAPARNTSDDARAERLEALRREQVAAKAAEAERLSKIGGLVDGMTLTPTTAELATKLEQLGQLTAPQIGRYSVPGRVNPENVGQHLKSGGNVHPEDYRGYLDHLKDVVRQNEIEAQNAAARTAPAQAPVSPPTAAPAPAPQVQPAATVIPDPSANPRFNWTTNISPAPATPAPATAAPIADANAAARGTAVPPRQNEHMATEAALAATVRKTEADKAANAVVDGDLTARGNARNALKDVAITLSPDEAFANKKLAHDTFAANYKGSGYVPLQGSEGEKQVVDLLGSKNIQYPRPPEKIAELLAARPMPMPEGIRDTNLTVEQRTAKIWELGPEHKFTETEAQNYLKHLKGQMLTAEARDITRRLVDFPAEPGARAEAIKEFVKSAEFNTDIKRLKEISADGVYTAANPQSASAQARPVRDIVNDIKSGENVSPQDAKALANGYKSYLTGEELHLEAKIITERLTNLYDPSNGLGKEIKREDKKLLADDFAKLKTIMDSDDYKSFIAHKTDADPDLGRQTRKSVDNILNDLREDNPISAREVATVKKFFMKWHNEDNEPGFVRSTFSSLTAGRFTDRHGLPGTGTAIVAGTAAVGTAVAIGTAVSSGSDSAKPSDTVGLSTGTVEAKITAATADANSAAALLRNRDARLHDDMVGRVGQLNTAMGGVLSQAELNQVMGLVVKEMVPRYEGDTALSKGEIAESMKDASKAMPTEIGGKIQQPIKDVISNLETTIDPNTGQPHSKTIVIGYKAPGVNP